MRFSRCVAVLAGISLIIICSCEEHHLGEMPDVQKEHVDLAKPGQETAPVPGESKTMRSPSATPAEFFPEKTPH